MRKPLLIAAILSVATILSGLYFLSALNDRHIPPGVVDPAIEFYTKVHPNSFADIDRWAHFGMRAKQFVQVLKKAGYECELPTRLNADVESESKQEILCRKTERWPITRTLSVVATIDHNLIDRIAGVYATSSIMQKDQFFVSQWASVLRKLELMEPEILHVNGFSVDSIEILNRMVADALLVGGWAAICRDEEPPTQCLDMANDRMRSGYPVVPLAPLTTGSALEMQRLMELIDFVSVQKRGNDGKPEDTLLVRVTEGRIWLDFASKDLIGHHLAASIELESKGGTPIRVVTNLDDERGEILLAGKSRTVSSGQATYLLPEAGSEETRSSAWLNLPDNRYPGTFNLLAKALPQSDPVFITPIIKAIIGDLTDTTRAEESLGLYPKLLQIEKMADVMGRLHLERWLSPEQGNPIIVQAYSDDPAIRAAWAFTSCKSVGNSLSIDRDCVLRFTFFDPEATQLVRHEITKLELFYAELPEHHPVHVRLQRLHEAFSI